jgi:Icc-related predicted phosphoesterase
MHCKNNVLFYAFHFIILKYSIGLLSSHMKICAIGDPHGDVQAIKHIPLKDVDLILLTGDIGRAELIRTMDVGNLKRQEQGLKPIKYTSKDFERAFWEIYRSAYQVVKYLSRFAPVLLIYGNVESLNLHPHSVAWYSRQTGKQLPLFSREITRLPGVRIINNRVANVQGVRIGGLEYFSDTCWLKEFRPPGYTRRGEYARKSTKKAKQVLSWFGDVDLLLSHQPPFGVLDKVRSNAVPRSWQNKRGGSKVILNYVKQRAPRFVLCGHIHEAKGTKKLGKSVVHNLGMGGYRFINLPDR